MSVTRVGQVVTIDSQLRQHPQHHESLLRAVSESINSFSYMYLWTMSGSDIALPSDLEKWLSQHMAARQAASPSDTQILESINVF